MKLYYIWDAYCGWSYGFNHILKEFLTNHSDINLKMISGGLFIDEHALPIGQFTDMARTNQAIAKLYGISFGEDYNDLLTQGDLVLDSTYPATAFAAMKNQIARHAHLDLALAIQNAFFQEGKSLSDASVYLDLARRFGLIKQVLRQELEEAFASQDLAKEDFEVAETLGVTSYPTLVLEVEGHYAVLDTAFSNSQAFEQEFLTAVAKLKKKRVTPSLAKEKIVTIIDYVNTYGQENFEAIPLNEVDIVCLNELGYVPFGRWLPEVLDSPRFFKLSELKPFVHADHTIQTDFLLTQDRLSLLEAILSSSRFSELEIGHYVNDISDEYEKQFAAMVMRLPSIDHTQLVFRGTDDTIVGWKEDFKMTYMSTIPAQYSALKYLQDFLVEETTQVIVSGHSKGGNLALYATSQIDKVLQDKVQAVYIFDSPGLQADLLARTAFERIRDRIIAFRPQESIVGVMLSTDMGYQTIESRGSGIVQHNVSHWMLTDRSFNRLPELSHFSQNLEKTFADWVASYSGQELKQLVDTAFDLFFDAGIDSLNDLSDNPSRRLKGLIGTLKDLDKPKRDLLGKSLINLLGTYNKHAIEQAWTNRPSPISDFLEKWQSREEDSEQSSEEGALDDL